MWQKRNKLCSFTKKKSENAIINIVILKLAFSESSFSKLYSIIIITTKHTPEGTNCIILKTFSGSMPPNPPSDIPQRDVFQQVESTFVAIDLFM